MMKNWPRRLSMCFAPIAIACFALTNLAMAEPQLTEPVYRVAKDTSGATVQPAPAASAPGASAPGVSAPGATAPVEEAASGSPFKLTHEANEHPLSPVLLALRKSQQHIDQNIRDYSCTFVKRERVEGELSDYQHIFMKVAHDPFSVYMSFLKPHAGREVVYVAGQNENKMVVLEAGFKRWAGKLHLDPQGALAMRGQRHPITSVGMRNLTEKLIKVFEAESKFAECEVKAVPDATIDGRSTTMFQITHPIPRKDFRNHISRIFFDNEHLMPIHYDAYSWPAQDGSPPLEEYYSYTNVTINNGYTARDFDPENNPEIFKQ